MLFTFCSWGEGEVVIFFKKPSVTSISCAYGNVAFFQRILKEERQIRERANAANIKLLHECEIVRNRLEECSVSFLIEEENKLVLEASSPSDAIDILSTSDNRIGLLLAEVCLFPLCVYL